MSLAWARPRPGSGATAQLGAPPWVAKLAHGSKGQGVMLVESWGALRSIADLFRELEQPLVLQAFIREAGACDHRLVVVGGEVIAAMRRQGREGEFRSNVHLGGHVEQIDPSAEMTALAVRATAAFGLEIAGVDLLESQHGYLVVEVNASPGVTGIQRALDAALSGQERIDVAEEIIRHVERAGPGSA